jgi:hypothetical protein
MKKTIGQKQIELINDYLFKGKRNIIDQVYIELYIAKNGKQIEFDKIEFERFKTSFQYIEKR